MISIFLFQNIRYIPSVKQEYPQTSLELIHNIIYKMVGLS